MTRRIPLVNRSGVVVGHALVDDADASRVSLYVWRLHGEGYAIAWTGTEYVLMHRLILGLQSKDGVHTDHENHNRLDNRRANLRAGTQQENNRNLGIRSRKHDLPPGVMPGGKRWRAFIGSQHLGMFDTPDEAAETARKAREERGW